MELVVAVSDLSDEQLAAEAAREGSDGPAFVAIVARFQDRVWRVCYRLMSNAEDASDAAQEVFVSLFLQQTEFVLQTLPYAFLYFLKAMIGACQFSLTGEFPNEGDHHAK